MDNLDSTVNKLIILYIFDAIEMPLAEDSIVDICYYDLKCMQYIDCKEAIANLLDAGLIVDAGGAGKGYAAGAGQGLSFRFRRQYG